MVRERGRKGNVLIAIQTTKRHYVAQDDVPKLYQLNLIPQSVATPEGRARAHTPYLRCVQDDASLLFRLSFVASVERVLSSKILHVFALVNLSTIN